MKTKEKNQPRSDLAEVVVRMRTKQGIYPRLRIKMEAKGYWIDWGDGVVDKRVTHYYKESGSYEVCIRAKSMSCLNLMQCDLEELDVSEAKGLKLLVCCFNHLTELDLTGLNELESVDCSENDLKRLVLGDYLETLECSSNVLGGLDLNGCKELVHLYCHNNKLTNISLCGCSKLRRIRCDRNCLDVEVLNNLIEILPVVHYPEDAHIMISNNPGSEHKAGSERFKLACLNHKGWNVDDESYL